jgi:protein-tyrosine phosphatase
LTNILKNKIENIIYSDVLDNTFTHGRRIEVGRVIKVSKNECFGKYYRWEVFSMSETKRIGVMFVCMGNICRSPMAEAIFQHLVDQSGLTDRFQVASSGTDSWHVGERPHPGTQNILRERNIKLNLNKRAQQVRKTDFKKYGYIIAMDSGNAARVKRFGNVRRLLDFAPPGNPKDVPDPYYERNFDYVYDLVMQGCKGLFEYIRRQEGIMDDPKDP